MSSVLRRRSDSDGGITDEDIVTPDIKERIFSKISVSRITIVVQVYEVGLL